MPIKKFVFLFLLLCLLIAYSLFMQQLNLSDWQANAWNEIYYFIIEFRLPRALAVCCVGASLALAGLLMQTQLSNPLAEPYTLGLSGGASLAACIALLFDFQPSWLYLPLFSLLGCFAVCFLLFQFIRILKSWKQHWIVLIGLMISLFCSSLVILILSILQPTKLYTAIYWMSGSFGSLRDHYWPFLFLVLLACTAWALKNARRLDYILLGEDLAKSMDTDFLKLRQNSFVIMTLLCAGSVAICGLVGFVGLTSAHMAQRLFGSNLHKYLIPSTILVGAISLLMADILSRSIMQNQEVPSGAIMAVLGAPFLISLLIKEVRRART